MSVRKLTAGLLTIVVMLGGIATADDWLHEPVVVDPFEFEPDFQWFEPVTNMDLADMKPKKRAHYGWFATYDRLMLYSSRPRTDVPQRLDTKVDYGGGQRYQVGFMVPQEDTGYLFNWTKNTVSEYDPVGPSTPPPPRFFEGYPISGLPILTGANSVNVATYESWELNKTWRLEPYHYGGFLEPMVGIRYMQIKDKNQFQNYLFPPPDAVDTDFGTVTSDYAFTANDMFGGQLGFRYFKFRERFTFSSDFRVFAGGSWQCSRYQRLVENLQEFDVTVIDQTEQRIIPVVLDRSPPILSRNQEGFVGFDVRAELAYTLTKYVSIRAGAQLIDVATGVWRGGDGNGPFEPGDQNQNMLMVGGTLGITLNR